MIAKIITGLYAELYSLPKKIASSTLRVLTAIARHLDWLTAVALIVAVTRPTLFVRGISIVVPHPNLLDDSWQVDIAYKALHGVWLGRDVIFTYGPLYQWITSLPSRLLGFSIATFIATREVPFFWLTIGFTYGASRIVLDAEPAWKRALFIALIVIFWSPFDIRVSAEILLFAVFLYLSDKVVNRRAGLLWAALSCAALLMCAFLISADTGMYSVVALIIVVSASVVLHWKTRRALTRLLWFALLTIAGFALLGVVANLVLGGGAFAYRFLKDGYAIVSAYRWVEPSPMIARDARVGAWTVATGFAIIVIAWRWRDSESMAITRRPLFLLATPLFALVALETAFVRSDWGHIIIGLFPIIFFAVAVLLGTGPVSLLRDSLCLFLAIGLTGMVAGPFQSFLPSSIKANLAGYSTIPGIAAADCHQAYVDRVCFGSPEGEMLVRTTTYLQQHTEADSSVLIYPYQNEVGVAAHRKVAGAVVQNYIVGGDYLTDRQLQGFESQRPAHGLYFVDGPGVVSIDGVSNFSRTPKLWFYMQSHYTTDAEVSEGVFGLIRDDHRAASVRQQQTALIDKEQSVSVTKKLEVIDIGPVRWPQDADFLRLGLIASYSEWWKLRKPAQIAVELEFADGSHKRKSLIVAPNTPYDVWVYPWDESSLGMFFDSAEANWRANMRPAVVRVRVIIQKSDWISLMPDRVTVLQADAVSLQQ